MINLVKFKKTISYICLMSKSFDGRRLLLLLLLLSQGCESSERVENEVCLQDAVSSIKEGSYKNLTTSIECLVLEADPDNLESFVESKAVIEHVDNEYIVVSSAYYSYVYDNKGHFLTRVGEIGKAHNEYSSRIFSVSVDAENKRLLYLTEDRKVQFWGFDGSYQHTVSFDIEGNIVGIELLDSKTIIANVNNYSENIFSNEIYVFDIDGSVLGKFNFQEFKISERTQDFYHFTEMTKYRDIVNIKSPYCDTIFSANREGLYSNIFMNLGKYKPSIEFLNFLNERSDNIGSMAYISGVLETDDYYLVRVNHNYIYRYVVIEKSTKQIVISDISKDFRNLGNGIYNDYIGNNFWAEYSSENTIYGLVDVVTLGDASRDNLVNYLPQNSQITEYTNYIIIKMELKRLYIE